MKDTERLLSWFDRVKRDLPWRRTHDPYCIWLSEIMLQQTRVETVKDYYRRFLENYPTVCDLANAPETDVLKAWEGLGYYSRARNLHKAAKKIRDEYQGAFPQSYEEILSLPGVGAYTAGAVGSIAFGLCHPAIDGNVKRVASRYFGIREDIASPSAGRQVEAELMGMLPGDRPGDFNQAMMELGATLCSPLHPACETCPLREGCDAYAEGDAESLPIHEKKAAPKRVDVGVCLLTHRGKVLLMQRKERMLGGLYVFCLTEGESRADVVRALLREDGLNVPDLSHEGQARHVFTHRVWEMKIYHAELPEAPGEAWMQAHHAVWADAEALKAYPLPTAVKVAGKRAMELLKPAEQSEI